MNVAFPCLNWMPSGLSECPLSDKLTIKENGYYKFWFTNKHSWLSTLTLNVKIKIIGAAST